MPRKTNPTPPVRLHRGSGQYYVQLDGKRHYLGRDKAKAEEARRRLIVRALSSPPDVRPVSGPGADPTVSECLLAYWRDAKGRYDTKQLARVRTARDAACELYGSTPAAEFDQVSLRAVRDHLLALRSRRVKSGEAPHLSRRYVNALVGCVQLAWGWLAERRLVPHAQAAAVQAVKRLRKGAGGREVPRVGSVPADVVGATLPHCNHVVAAMVRLQQRTGMRPGEVVVMRRRDLSLSPAEKLEVPETDPPQRVGALDIDGVLCWVYVPESHKTLWRGKRRLVPIGPAGQAVLAPFLEGRGSDAFLFSAKEAMDAWRAARGQKAVYGRIPNDRYTTQSYGKSIASAVDAANSARLAFGPCRPEDLLPQWSPNKLRKLASTEAEDVADRDTAAALLGHSNPQTTAIYSETQLRKAARLVAKTG